MKNKVKKFKEVLIISGSKKLSGTIKISGAKNAALPNMAASILTDEYVYLNNVPELLDTLTMEKLLNEIGIKSYKKDGSLLLKFENKPNLKADYDYVSKMRASILVLGPLLTRFGHAEVALPGGCAIGTRPINLHLEALKKMGADIHLKEGNIVANAKDGLQGATIKFDRITVTGTENIMMAATLAKGKTIIKNAAKEPEVVNLANLLIRMGAKIKGAGTDTIEIEGVNKLNSATIDIIPDRIEAGTFAILSALTGENITIENYPFEYLEYFDRVLENIGVSIIRIDKNTAVVKRGEKLKPTHIETKEYPYFPTDLQAQLMVLLCFAEGISSIKENIFENRFMHVPELCRMGAQIKIDVESRTAYIKGIKQLEGTIVKATDLRASAAMVIAGLTAKGITTIENIYHLYRGYEKIDEKLKSIGAEIKKDIIEEKGA